MCASRCSGARDDGSAAEERGAHQPRSGGPVPQRRDGHPQVRDTRRLAVCCLTLFLCFLTGVSCCRHSSDRVSRLEAMVETYKLKLEDLGDLRRQVRLLEERNHVYMQRTCELEEEQRRANAIRSQLDSYKRQVKERCVHCSGQHTISTRTSSQCLSLTIHKHLHAAAHRV